MVIFCVSCVFQSSIFPGGKCSMVSYHSSKGFTLSELLVSLSVLGLIAAFAIPKVLTAVDTQATKAVGKEAISMITAAYDSLKADNDGVVGKSTTADALAGKMNYVKSDPATLSGVYTKLTLHNGGTVSFNGADNFVPVTAGTEPGMMTFNIDPNGYAGTTAASQTSSEKGPGPVTVALGYDGRLFLVDDGYKSGTTTASPFLANYDNGGANNGIALVAPSVTDGADTSWMEW
jgi:prepilin-type N-terminal cleavage/methylation domain-containing protein